MADAQVCATAGFSGGYLLTEFLAKQIEKAYQKQHLFQNAKVRGASRYRTEHSAEIDDRCRRQDCEQAEAMDQGCWYGDQDAS